ncbi:twin-arginine translocation signal domain-containing protein [Amycolatopsis nigrescens]|uniref:twin-arginine translocation signal domain-containing protein n=1 Tax=Amycolatopsis nigrescens TaxID=381445 RepID=UPI00037D549E|nr:twin-arginine translocation signal domain-containing protein [Amycolatopsis nigrescens]
MSTFSDSSAGGVGRRRFLTGVAATGGAAALGLLGTSTARATHQSGLPPIGAEIPCSMLAINVPLKIRTALMSVDFKGGIKHRVDVNPDDPENSVRLRTVGFRMTAEMPDIGDGARQDGGTITLEQDDVDVDPQSLLRLTQRFPLRYEHVSVLTFTMTIDQPDTYARIYEPLVLTTKDPAQLVGKLTQFPPRGDLYKLQNPVELVLPEDPDTTIVTIQRFPVKVGGL